MKTRHLLLASVLLPSLNAPGLTITVDAEVLKDQFGNAMAPTGVVVLTAATQGSFGGPFSSSFVSGSEMFLASWDLSAWNFDGVFTGITADLAFTGDWGEGDPLRLYWYPSLTINEAGPSAGISYGTYTDPLGVDGSAPWITPAQSDNISLSFYTADAFFLRDGGAPYPFGGSNDPSAGVAALFVPPTTGQPIPETGSTLWLLGSSFAGLVSLRRLRSRG